MDSKFLFGIDDEQIIDRKSLRENDESLCKIKNDIKEDIDYAKIQLSDLNNQVSNLEIGNVTHSLQFKKCAILVEYLCNVYAFHVLKNMSDESTKSRLFKRLNNLKCVMDRLSPLESRLSSYIKDLNKNHPKHQNSRKEVQSIIATQIDDGKIECLKPNLHGLADIIDDSVDENELHPNLSNLVPADNNTLYEINNEEIVNDEMSFNADTMENIINKNTSKSKPEKTSIFIPSKSKYVPYDNSKNSKITSRKRKEIDEEHLHKKELQQTIVDDLLNLDSDAPIISGMKETNNGGYFEKNNPFSKSSSNRDIQMIKDRRLVLMMNGDDGNDLFTDVTMEKLTDEMSNKLKSKKHKQKLAKRRESRIRFRRKMFKRRR